MAQACQVLLWVFKHKTLVSSKELKAFTVSAIMHICFVFFVLTLRSVFRDSSPLIAGEKTVIFFNQLLAFTALTIILSLGFGVHDGDILYMSILWCSEMTAIMSWPLKKGEQVWLPLIYFLLTVFLYKEELSQEYQQWGTTSITLNLPNHWFFILLNGLDYLLRQFCRRLFSYTIKISIFLLPKNI